MTSEFKIFRHQEAEYKLNKEVLDSDNPQDPVSAENQNFESDLTETGKERAREQAQEFFKKYKPDSQAFFVVSSDFVRAAETAKIYVDVAEELGFEVISPEKPHSSIVETVGQGKVKHLESLSLDIDNALLDQLFNANTDYLERASARGVKFDEDLVGRWGKARRIIESDNKGSWSENWRHHGNTVKEILPEITTANEMYSTKFQNLVRLMKYGDKKIEESEYPKQVTVLAFTHENLFTHWLSEAMNESGLELGEMVSFQVEKDDQVRASVRGKEVDVD